MARTNPISEVAKLGACLRFRPVGPSFPCVRAEGSDRFFSLPEDLHVRCCEYSANMIPI